jgi:hypothetical protein
MAAAVMVLFALLFHEKGDGRVAEPLKAPEEAPK